MSRLYHSTVKYFAPLVRYDPTDFNGK